MTATQDSLSAGGAPLAERDSNPLGHYIGFQYVWLLHDILLIEAFLTHSTGLGRGERAQPAKPASTHRGWASSDELVGEEEPTAEGP